MEDTCISRFYKWISRGGQTISINGKTTITRTEAGYTIEAAGLILESAAQCKTVGKGSKTSVRHLKSKKAKPQCAR